MANNALYKDIKINYHLLDIKKDKFIYFGIIDCMIYCNCNHYKYADYTADFFNNNYENDFDTIIADINIEKDHIYSSYIYSDINDKR